MLEHLGQLAVNTQNHKGVKKIEATLNSRQNKKLYKKINDHSSTVNNIYRAQLSNKSKFTQSYHCNRNIEEKKGDVEVSYVRKLYPHLP